MRYLWKFYWDCGRRGEISGLFVDTEKKVHSCLGKDVYFGEILGKHSEVYGVIEPGEITKVDLDSETVEKVAKILGDTWSGYNPLQYIKIKCPKCGDKVRGWEFDEELNMCSDCLDEQ